MPKFGHKELINSLPNQDVSFGPIEPIDEN